MSSIYIETGCGKYLQFDNHGNVTYTSDKQRATVFAADTHPDPTDYRELRIFARTIKRIPAPISA